MKYSDVIGKKIGKLLIIGKAPGIKGRVVCLCDCGNTTIKYVANIAVSKTHSCGCEVRRMCGERHYIHGGCKRIQHEKLYDIWQHIRSRCENPKDKRYKNYGGRGIKICKEWKDYSVFRNDMSGGYNPGLQIDRIDNNKGYSKGNCRWATIKQQANNKTTNRFITFQGQTLTQRQWEERLGLRKGIICQRITVLGWDEERALTTPYKPLKHKKQSLSNAPIAEAALVRKIRAALGDE